MKVSLISTVKDPGPHVGEFLDSLHAQSRSPDEVIVVDGGSTDGTLEALGADAMITVVSEPGASIARGRNSAIERASHDVIAVTDADCVLEPTWLERLVAPFEEDGVDVVAGFYRPLAPAPWQVWASAHIPDPDEVGPGWMPSSRSIAFRRAAWEWAGRYPEWLVVGEDMYFNHRLVEAGCRIVHATDAVVAWRVRPTVLQTLRQYARYAEGDALAGMYTGRHAARFTAYAVGTFAVVSRNRPLTALSAIGTAVYTAKPTARALGRLHSPETRAAALIGVPLMTVLIDAAKMAGYIRGGSVPVREHSSPLPIQDGSMTSNSPV